MMSTHYGNRRDADEKTRYQAGYDRGSLGRGVTDRRGHTAPYLEGLAAGLVAFRGLTKERQAGQRERDRIRKSEQRARDKVRKAEQRLRDNAKKAQRLKDDWERQRKKHARDSQRQEERREDIRSAEMRDEKQAQAKAAHETMSAHQRYLQQLDEALERANST